MSFRKTTAGLAVATFLPVAAFGCQAVLGLGDLTPADAGSDRGSPRDGVAHVDAVHNDGTSGDAAPGDATADAKSRDATTGDARTPDATTGDAKTDHANAPDASTPHDAGEDACATGLCVYVNHNATPGGDGSVDAPYTMISAAVARTNASIVSGAAVTYIVAAGTYMNENDLELAASQTLRGAGPGAEGTVISGIWSSDCVSPNAPCILLLQPGSALDNVSIGLPGNAERDGGYSGLMVAASGAPSAPATTVSRFSFTAGGGGYISTGILAYNSMTLGPEISSSGCGLGNGMNVNGNVTVTVVGSPSNHFDLNHLNGIAVTGTARLIFQGGTTSDNTNNGIVFATTAAEQHVTSLSAHGNGHDGITVNRGTTGATATITVRDSDLTGNAVGISYEYGNDAGGLPLDLGTDASPGNNVLIGDAGGAGVLLCGAKRAPPVRGDTFSTCPPSTARATSCAGPPLHYAAGSGPYADIVYAPSVDAGMPDAAINLGPTCTCVADAARCP